MPYTITPDPRPNTYIVHIIGDYALADNFVDEVSRLNDSRHAYILVDTSQMSSALPEGFMEYVKDKNFVQSLSRAYIAVYTTSPVIRLLTQMILKLTRQGNKVAVFESYKAAHAHLYRVMDEAGVSQK